MTAKVSATGIASHGDSQTMTSMNRAANGRSISAVTVVEAMKSRTCSKPRRLLANEPTDSGRLASFMPSTRSISRAESVTHRARQLGVAHVVLGADLKIGPWDQLRAQLGIPAEAAYVEAYCRRTDRAGVDNWNFYLAYNMFRLAAYLVAHCSAVASTLMFHRRISLRAKVRSK